MTVSIPQVGSRLAAFTGLAGIGFLDTMVVTEYDPPWRWVMQHDGAFVMGVGIFEITPTATGCRFTWAEELDLPFGVLGRLGWPLVKPIAHLALLACLRRMARQLERGTLPLAMAPDALPRDALAATGRAGTGGDVVMTPGEPTVAAPALDPAAAAPTTATSRGPDDRVRCWWGSSAPEYIEYHDLEWGRPLHGDDALYERLCLEAFQSGLSWLTILRKRENFRRAFDGFVIDKVATYGDADVQRLLGDASIVRNRAKIEASINNARVAADLDTSLDDLLWSFAPQTPRPRPVDHGRSAGDHRRIEGHGQGAQAAGLQVLRTDHRLCADAGDGHGRRPRRGLLAGCDDAR